MDFYSWAKLVVSLLEKSIPLFHASAWQPRNRSYISSPRCVLQNHGIYWHCVTCLSRGVYWQRLTLTGPRGWRPLCLFCAGEQTSTRLEKAWWLLRQGYGQLWTKQSHRQSSPSPSDIASLCKWLCVFVPTCVPSQIYVNLSGAGLCVCVPLYMWELVVHVCVMNYTFLSIHIILLGCQFFYSINHLVFGGNRGWGRVFKIAFFCPADSLKTKDILCSKT